MADARFEDGDERPLRLVAQDESDLAILSALVQDSVLTGADFSWSARKRRFALLINRFRWEDQMKAGGKVAETRAPERVRSMLVFDDVSHVAHQGLGQRDSETILSLLTVTYAAETVPEEVSEGPIPAGPGRVTLVFAGDGAVALTVSCLDVSLTDVTRPYTAPSRRIPTHADLPQD